MFELLGIPPQALFGQLLLGLINGSFYAMLSLGLAVIFGLLRVINFAHGAQYMLGAFAAYLLLSWLGIGYWPALILAPVIVGAIAVVIEKTMLSRLYRLDHLYGLLLTFGLALIIEGMFQRWYGVSGLPYVTPAALTGGYNLGFMFLPAYRGWVVVASVVVCFATWFLIERTRLGAYLLDLAVRFAALYGVVTVLSFALLPFATTGLPVGVYFVVAFLLEWGYGCFFETWWNGQTPGKRAFGLRVIKTEGYAIGFHEAMIRNLLRAADFAKAARFGSTRLPGENDAPGITGRHHRRTDREGPGRRSEPTARVSNRLPA